MGKWTVVYTNATKSEKTDAEKRAAAKALNRAIKQATSKSAIELKKESDARYAAKQAQDEALLAAYDAKKLKSARLIKEAKALATARDKASDKKAVAEVTA